MYIQRFYTNISRVLGNLGYSSKVFYLPTYLPACLHICYTNASSVTYLYVFGASSTHRILGTLRTIPGQAGIYAFFD